MRSILAFIVASFFCMAAEPLMRFDFSKAENGRAPNMGTGSQYAAQIQGKVETSGEILKMDGRTSKVIVEGTEDFDVSKNYTFMLLYKREDLPGNDDTNVLMDSFFAKPGVFVMSKYKNTFYANGKVDGKWAVDARAPDVFRQDDAEWHHVAMSLEYRLNWNDAEEWVEYVFYKDGVSCGKYQFKNVRLDKGKSLLEIGFNSVMGPPWSLGGEIADARVYEGVLSLAEIREIVLAQKLAKPAFTVEYQLTEDEERQLAAKRLAPELQSAIRNLALVETAHYDWRAIMADAPKALLVLDGGDSCLVLVNVDGHVSICSWYDRKAKRELLKGNNAFVSWTVEHWKKAGDGTMKSSHLESFEAIDGRVSSRLAEPPKRDASGKWHFDIQYDSDSLALSARSSFAFDGKRLEFTHKAASLKEGQTMHSLLYPKCSLRQLGKSDALVVPEGSGVVYVNPCVNNVRYATYYPRSVCSMQFCSYYDQTGGVYIATQDPWARRKEMLFIGAPGRLDGSIAWRVPYDNPGQPNEFDTGTSAVLELFRGDWYDAGLIYKADVAAMKADWWIPKLPKTTSRKDIMENCIWVNANYSGKIPDELFALKDYLGQNFYVGDVWYWWEQGIGTHLSPTMRATPEWIEYVKVLKEHGLCTMPYMDGRLWAEKDRRGEDWMYSKFGHRMNIVSDGKPVREMYKNPCDTLCPATPEYQEHFFEFIRTITMQGLNGLYIDQLGAGLPPPCHVASHGHRYAEWFSSYRDGYAKLLRCLRDYWSSQGKEMVLSTEDAVEQFCTLLDVYQPYRWIYENQVPLFPLVYSGRIQFYNRHAMTTGARFQTTAEQLLNSEQPGIFTPMELLAPPNHELRRYAKRLAWARHALLDFFNAGQMARPPMMLREMPRIRRFWDKFGTHFVTKPQVQCAAWDYGETRVVILINTEATPHSNVVRFELPSKQCKVEILSCNAATRCSTIVSDIAELEFTLNPRMLMLMVAYPESKRPQALMAKIEEDFVKVRETLSEPDPFLKHDWPDTEPIDATKGANFIDSAYIQGCRASRELGRIDFVSYATLCPGTVDFGDSPKKALVVEVACGDLKGGELKLFLDGANAENLYGELELDRNFKTAAWNAFEERRIVFQKPVSGQHKLILFVPGKGFCNLRSWRAE